MNFDGSRVESSCDLQLSTEDTGMLKQIFALSFLILAALFGGFSPKPTKAVPMVTAVSVYGAWHCGNEFCSWATVRNMTDFDNRNRWLINRGDGTPSVNLVVLSFVQPLKLLNKTTDAGNTLGVPTGMTQAVVDYFKSRGIRVQLSIGGITYVAPWNQALATNPTQLGLNAAEVAQRLGVGIEIDYEENMNPNLTGLQAFIDAYRSVHPYDASGNNHAARLTIDLAAGDRWLIPLTRKATADWLNTTTPVLDYANAMVTSKQFNNAADAQTNWQEHIDGKAQFDPVILPLAPAKFTGALYIVTGSRAAPECTSFSSSLINSTGAYVQSVAPNGAGTTSGMLGYMFWAAECPSSRRVCTTPPNSCEGGVGVGATTYNIPIPMAPLRQN
jgi:hypothetical protein